MENITVLPKEVEVLTLAVTPEKRNEVQLIIHQVFDHTEAWASQVDGLEIKNIEDRLNIDLAEAYRINIKKTRLAAEKLFDSKREEVQQKMADYKTEDALWLKAKQVMQIRFKAIEEKAEYKARFVERYQSEQKAIRTEIRRQQVDQFADGIQAGDYENLTDELFTILITGLEKRHKENQEAIKLRKKEALEAQAAREKEEEENWAKFLALREENKKKAAQVVKLKEGAKAAAIAQAASQQKLKDLEKANQEAEDRLKARDEQFKKEAEDRAREEKRKTGALAIFTKEILAEVVAGGSPQEITERILNVIRKYKLIKG